MGYSGYKTKFIGIGVDGADERGFVVEHRYVAEQMLGRKLAPLEVVHHINHIRTDNRPENLLVFRTREDHARYHAGGTLERQEDGTYISNSFLQEIACSYCGQEFRPSSTKTMYCCAECAQLASRKVERPTKKELKKLLLEFNITQISQIYGITGNGIRRWCQYYKLPYKRKEILKLRETEQKKADEKAAKKEMKERQQERDKLKKQHANE